MNSLVDMIQRVKLRLRIGKHEVIEDESWLNSNRNYSIKTDKRRYLLKWNDQLFRAAGVLVPNLKPATAGLSIDRYTVERFIDTDMHTRSASLILFAWRNQDKIYFVGAATFNHLSEPYQQKSGEWERVISVKSVMPWE